MGETKLEEGRRQTNSKRIAAETEPGFGVVEGFKKEKSRKKERKKHIERECEDKADTAEVKRLRIAKLQGQACRNTKETWKNVCIVYRRLGKRVPERM
jgi:hypothetical protein